MIEKAEDFFRTQKNKCSYSDPASREMAMIYQLGLEGIRRIKEDGEGMVANKQ